MNFFYGAVSPGVALKVMQGPSPKPTLKGAFSGTNPTTGTQENLAPPKNALHILAATAKLFLKNQVEFFILKNISLEMCQ